MTTQVIDDIVDNISALIGTALSAQASESTNPTRSADQMDDYIKFHRERVATLRRLRVEFEDEMARTVPLNH